MPPILFEDERFIVLNKPAGLLSIPGRNVEEASLVDVLKAHDPDQRYYVVHRIDRGTSGVILFAKTEESHRVASGWFQKHEVKKEYLALAEGTPRLPAVRVNRPIEGKTSLSQIQVLERFAGAFLARVRIATGRRHQIRIHLQGEGFPIFGDERYGGKKNFLGSIFLRVALHAEKLVLPAEPGSGAASARAAVEITAPVPEDFLKWCAEFRMAANRE